MALINSIPGSLLLGESVFGVMIFGLIAGHIRGDLE